MEKLKMHSPDLAEQNIDKIAELFPSVVTESLDADGNPVRAIDFDLLRQELSDHVVEGPQERYQLDWPGKRTALFEANAPIAKTLRPSRGESVDFDNTQNLFIEGDNLEALKLIQESYLGKVDLIFIDPPYNTGSDVFVYPDNFAISSLDYQIRSGQADGSGYRLTSNTQANGRFHSDWLSMIYPRVKLARNLLSPAGLLCITVDDNEGSAMELIGREIFGDQNFVARVIWKHTEQSKNDETYFSRHHNYLLMFRRGPALSRFRLPRTEKDNKAYSNPDNDTRGPWRSGDVRSPNPRPSLRYRVPNPSGGFIEPPENGWRWSWDTMKGKIDSGEITFMDGGDRLLRKIYLSDQEGRTPETVWIGDQVGTTREATAEIKDIFGQAVFDTPKPTRLIRRVLELLADPKAIVLDFFAGSSSTAHAVMAQNLLDGGHRRFIMVQGPDPCDPNSAAAAAGFSTVSQVSIERIRKVGARLGLNRAGSSENADLGVRVLKVDTTNLSPVLRTADELAQGELPLLARNVKLDRTSEDLLFEVILQCGLEPTVSVSILELDSNEIFVVADGALIACFEDALTVEVIRKIADMRPLKAVFVDSSFESDTDRINAAQIFSELSPLTDVRVV